MDFDLNFSVIIIFNGPCELILVTFADFTARAVFSDIRELNATAAPTLPSSKSRVSDPRRRHNFIWENALHTYTRRRMNGRDRKSE